jgi:hypothetical protein
MMGFKFVIGVSSSLEQLERYLGFGAEIAESRERPKTNGVVAVISVPEEHAEWQSMRLASGLSGGGRVYDASEQVQLDEMYEFHATH